MKKRTFIIKVLKLIAIILSLLIVMTVVIGILFIFEDKIGKDVEG